MLPVATDNIQNLDAVGTAEENSLGAERKNEVS